MSLTMKTLTAGINTVKAKLDTAKVTGDTKWAAALSQKLASLISERNGLEVERYERWNVIEVIR